MAQNTAHTCEIDDFTDAVCNLRVFFFMNRFMVAVAIMSTVLWTTIPPSTKLLACDDSALSVHFV